VSRSGYIDDIDQWPLIRWRGQVASAIRGKRGQALLREMLAALDAMPVKRLIAHDLKDATGEVCALGCLGVARGLDFDGIDPEEPDDVAHAFGVAHQLVAEIAFENDEAAAYPESPEHRWLRMRTWVAAQIKPALGGAPEP